MLGMALVLAVHVAGVADVASPRPAGWVTDQAHVLDPPTVATLNEIVAELHRARGVELAIVTVDDVPGTPKAFATELFNTWHIGTAGKNDGVLVLLVMGKRRLEVETGTGIEPVLPAAWLAEMQQRDMVPLFKRAEFPQGLITGVRAIAAHIRVQTGEAAAPGPAGEYRSDGQVVAPAQPQPMPPSSPPPQPVAAPPHDQDNPLLLFGSIGAIGAGGIGAVGVWARRRRRQCAQCKIDMVVLDERADDAHLGEGERAEERVGSVDYEVLSCTRCAATRTIRHNKWFSGYSRCSSCHAKTLRSWSRTLRAATTYSTGEVEVNEQCAHCNYQNRYTQTTAMLSSSSSSSSSSDSSSSTFSSSSSSSDSGFSGGSSSGGGAGSSW
jgi:uncharacterized protein